MKLNFKIFCKLTQTCTNFFKITQISQTHLNPCKEKLCECHLFLYRSFVLIYKSESMGGVCVPSHLSQTWLCDLFSGACPKRNNIYQTMCLPQKGLYVQFFLLIPKRINYFINMVPTSDSTKYAIHLTYNYRAKKLNSR